MNVADFATATQMTEAAYQAERAELRATYGDTAVERSGLFDQALAQLFYRTGWTQDRLAAAEGKNQSWIVRRVRFGRFLAFMPMGIIPKSCNERRFRGFWDRTDKTESNERIRFLAVRKLMDDELAFSKNRSKAAKRHVARAILDTSADGSWHHLHVIVERAHAVDDRVTEADVVAVLTQMLTRQTYHTFCERRKGGTSWSYRIVRGRGRKVDVEVLVQELSPIVQALKVEGRKHAARCSPGTIATLAHQLDAILERLAHVTTRLSQPPSPGAEAHGPVSTTQV